MAGPDFSLDLDGGYVDDDGNGDAWDPVPAFVCRRRSDGAIRFWDGSSWADPAGGGGGGGAVSSVFGRTGDVVGELSDYAAGLIQNDAGLPPGTATVAEALANLHARVEALELAP